MGRVILTSRESENSGLSYDLGSAESNETVVVPAVQSGSYLLADADTGAAPDNVYLSREGDDLNISLAESAAPAAVIAGHYASPSMLTVPAGDNKVQALDTFNLTSESTQVLGANLPQPGAPGFIVIDGVTDDEGASTGEIANGGATDDTTPTLHGHIDGGAGLAIDIYANTVLLGTVRVGDDDSWSFTPTTPLQADGSYTFEVLLQDPASSTILVSMPFVISDVADGAPTDNLPQPGNDDIIHIDGLTDDTGLHQGEVQNGGVTDDTQPVLHGSVPGGEGLPLDIYMNTVKVGHVIIGDDGSWSFQVPAEYALENNSEYTFQVMLNDPAGAGRFIAMPFTVDTGVDLLVPTITQAIDDVAKYTGNIANGGLTNDSQLEYHGTADPNAIVRLYDGDTLLGSTLTDASGNWVFTPATPMTAQGMHNITATASDVDGVETKHSASYDINLDTIAETPVITGYFDDSGVHTGNIENNGKSDDTSPTLSGTGEAGATLSIRAKGASGVWYDMGSTTVDADGHWTIDVSLLDRAFTKWTFEAAEIDPAGNTSNYSDDYVVNFVAPNTDDDSTPPAATDVTATDDVGPIQGPITNGSSTDDSTPTFSGNATPGDTVIINDNGKPIGSTTVNTDGSWSYTPTTPLPDGAHNIDTVVVNPNNGNQSPNSDPINFTVDTHADVPVITSITDDVDPITGVVTEGGFTNDSTPTLAGTSEAGSLVKIFANGTEIGSTTADADGKWTFTTPESADGQYAFTAQETDVAGNTSDMSAPYDITIDTTAPDVIDITSPDNLTVTDDVGPIQGPVAENGVTDDTMPTFSGKNQDPGNTITIYDNDEVIGSAVVDKDGNWSFTPDTALPEGPQAIELVATDPAGNSSDKSAPFDFSIDTSAASVTLDSVVDDVGTITGALTNGDVTDDANPTLNGTATAGDTVNIYDNGKLIGSVVSDADGKWTFTPATALVDGDHALTATVISPTTGESAPTDAFNIVVDTVPPDVIDITSPDNLTVTDDVGPIQGPVAENGVTDDTTPTFSGKGQEPGNTITIYDNGDEIGSAVVDQDGNWSFTPTDPLPEGPQEIQLVATDPAGNSSDKSAPFDFSIDTSVATVTLDSVVDDVGTITGALANGDVTDDANPTLSGTATAGDTVNIYDNGKLIGSVVSDADGKWTFTPATALVDGDHALTATVVSPVTGESAPTDAFNIVVDTVPPDVIDITSPDNLTVTDDVGPIQGPVAENGVTDDTTPTFSGKGQEPGNTITIYDNGDEIGSAVVDQDGNWSFTPTDPLPEGPQEIQLVATDPAGNSSDKSAPFDFNIDTSVATVTLDSVVDDVAPIVGDLTNGEVTNDANPTLNGTATAGDTVNIYDNGKQIGSVVADADGKWTFTPTDALVDGDHALTATVVSPTTGESAPTDAFNIVVDTTPPAVIDVTVPDNLTITDNVGPVQGPIAEDGVTDDTKPVFSGKNQEPGNTITIYDNDTEIGSAVVQQDGTWSFTPTTDLPLGPQAIELVATDPAGNSSDRSAPFDFSIDVMGNITLDTVYDDAGTITGFLTDGEVTDDSTPTLNGTATAGGLVNIYDNGKLIGSVVAGDDGKWAFTPADADKLTDGAHALTATVVTAAGGESDPTDAFNIVVDTTAPAVPDNMTVTDNVDPIQGVVVAGGSTNDNEPVISGTGQNPGDTITVYDNDNVIGTAVVDADGNWSMQPTSPLTDGAQSLELTATDPVGNESDKSAPFDFTVDTIAPPATDVVITDDSGNTIPDGGSTTDGTPTFSGDGAEPGDTVIINDDGKPIGSVVVDDNGHWDFTPDTPLDPGEHTIDTVVVDPAGNESPASDPIVIGVSTHGYVDFDNVDKQAFTVGDSLTLSNGLVITYTKAGVDGSSHNAYQEITNKGIGLFAPAFGKQAMTLLANSEMRFDFGNTNAVSFDVNSANYKGTSVHYYDADGHEIGSQAIAPQTGTGANTISFDAPAGSLISYMTIDVGPESGSDVEIRVDNFAWGGDAKPATPEHIDGTMSHGVSALHADVAQVDAVHTDAVATDAQADTHQADAHMEVAQNHTLALSLDDVLSHGEQNLMVDDGKVQVAITGETGDQVELSGVSEQSLAQHGSVTSDGVAYDVYSVSGSNAELLVQHGLELHAQTTTHS